ncbi:hypothetical protein TRFO_28176 [Tritrichomonas foetus]|uniref:Peptidase M60 domain-containing protein n=1 Tax=Tritrichomonas foetus TaxID=1144522 RepID=A0A1J4K478_9EUKA|nr:hypothetical protein TRFO_28176 [Tritrichomonas foetus]|eukprot:OHT04301.1 hypothetical protein TRFO_28176 [Tritrichomonas foetus]
MGCGPSTPQPKGDKPRVSNTVNNNTTNNQANIKKDPNISLMQCFDYIISGAKTIAAPSNMMPVVCLARESFPIVTSFLHLEDSTPTEIQLPIVAGSMAGNGRVICFSQLQFLSQKCIRAADTKTLITNAINWISGGQNTMTPIIALGFEKQMQQNIIRTFQDLGFFIENGSFHSNFSSYKAIIIPSHVDLSDQERFDKLNDYVKVNGGGLAVFYNHSEMGTLAMPINRLLLKFNLSFTYCLLNEDMDPIDNIQLPSSFTYIRDSNFIPLLARFKAIVKQSHVDTSALDDLVTTLRYYIMVCDEGHSEQLEDACQYAWEFLKRTNYHTDEGICPDITHGIVVVLLLDIYAKLPQEQVKPIPEHEVFPGKTGQVKLDDYNITIHLQNETWISTGLWLPAGVVGTVECESAMPDIHVQIGSHHESLLAKPGPWKRWPSTVQVYPLLEKVTPVVTAFGGIVYIAVNNSNEQDPRPLSIKFHQFCKHPMADCENPKIWEETKDIEVPWGELKAGSVIFTLPSDELRKIKDFNIINEKFQIIVDEISKYMSYTPDRPYRVVFDVELPDDCPSCGYPLVFRVDDIDGILNKFDKPSIQLFTAVTLMTIVSIREDVFDQVTETAIATIATSVVFKRLFPDFDPLEFAGISLPTLFHELWEIHSRFDQTLIPKTLEKFQDTEYPVLDVPEDMWIAFVREMCRIGKRDFTKLLERSRPIPLNISISLQGLPPYQFVGCQ